MKGMAFLLVILCLGILNVQPIDAFSTQGLPPTFVSFFDICKENFNICRKELPNNVTMFLSWPNSDQYIVSFGNNNPYNISGVYDVEVRFRSSFDDLTLVALGNDIIEPKEIKENSVVFDYNKSIAAGGYGKAFITLFVEPSKASQPSTAPPATSAPTTTPPPLMAATSPPTTTAIAPTAPPSTTTPPATTTPPVTEAQPESLWKAPRTLILVVVLSIAASIILIKSGVLERG
ncbi:MAG: hypothetical protein ACE5PM_00435 [Candidatus Hydrothermarchaeales archaeon]